MESTVKRWRCDVCGEWVTSEQGYVVWNYVNDHMRTGFQIIHRGREGCDDHSKPASSALVDFLGPDGFARTTALMVVGPIMRNQSPNAEFIEHRIADAEEFVDFMRRLYVPNYEEARNKFNAHEVLEDYQSSNETRPYMQDALKYIASKKVD
jgi:hypothetical protein